MEETIGQIDRLALAGYIWLSRTLGVLRLDEPTGYIVFFMGIALAGFIWGALRGSFKQMEGSGSAAWEMVKFGISVFAGFLLLYGVVRDVSPLFAQSSTRISTLAKDVSSTNASGKSAAAAFYPGYLVERYFSIPLIEMALAIVNPENRAMFGSPLDSARRVVAEPDVGNDPQYNATRAVWRDVVAPALLEKSPALRDALTRQQLLSYYYNPRSDLPQGAFTSSNFANAKADAVLKLLGNSSLVRPADFIAVVRDLGPLMAERSSGYQAWAVGNSGVVVPILGNASLEIIGDPSGASWAPQTVPAEIANPANGGSDARVANAYAAGWRTLRSVLTDSGRLPTSDPFSDPAQLYQNIGRAGDLAAAASLITDPNRVLLFGVTCQKVTEKYCPIILGGATERQMQADASGGGDWSRWFARKVGALISAPGAILSSFLTWLASEGVPLAIGYTKFALILLTPVGVALLFWPGRAELSIKVLVGGFVFLGLFEFFYIIWDAAVSTATWSLSGVISGSNDPTRNELAAAVDDIGWLGVTSVQMFKLGGYALLGFLAWAFTFDAIDSAYKLTQRAGGGSEQGGGAKDVSMAKGLYTGAKAKGGK